MRVGLDGYPLCEPLTGVGHYTFELACALAQRFPADEFQLIAPQAFDPAVVGRAQKENLSNLKLVNLKLKSAAVGGRFICRVTCAVSGSISFTERITSCLYGIDDAAS